jgi:hypothetical protein
MSLQDASDVAPIAQLLLALVVTFGGSFLALQYIRKNAAGFEHMSAKKS